MTERELYYRTTAILRVGLTPDKLDDKLDDNILVTLKNKYENIASEIGVIVKINSVLKYDYGFIGTSTFTSIVNYDVECDIYNCNPVAGLEFYAKITRIALNTVGQIILENGPVIVTVQRNEINTNVFEIKSDSISYKDTYKQVEIGDIMKLSAINSRGKRRNNKILVVSKLLDRADKRGIEKYNYEMQDILNINTKIEDELI